MTILLDREQVSPDLAQASTLADALAWATGHLQGSGKVIVKVELDGQPLAGPALSDHHATPLAARKLDISTALQKDLALAMLGKLAALVEYLGGQHRHVAEMIEKGQSDKAMEGLAQVLSAWQQVQQSFGSLCTMLDLDLATLSAGEQAADERLAEFARQLGEIQQALQNADMVLLADILQYEMDRAVEIWNSILAAVLGTVEPVG